MLSLPDGVLQVQDELGTALQPHTERRVQKSEDEEDRQKTERLPSTKRKKLGYPQQGSPYQIVQEVRK